MASEEIKLIGSFKDDITPQLKKLNKQIESVGRSFGKFSRNLRPIAKEFGRMAGASRQFNDELRQQAKLMNSSSRAMREYKTQAGKMVGAMRAVEAQRQKAMRAAGVSKAEQKRGGGGAVPVPGGPAPSKGAGAKAGATIGASAGQSFMKNIASTAIGIGIANAFMGGVQKVKNMFMAPFQKFGAAFNERISDEMDDLKSAGGMYALDMDLTSASGNERLFKNFNDSLRFQEEINTRMAQSASNLPGTTSEFVMMNRRLTDTVQMVMENNRESFIKFGEEQGADVSGGGIDAAKEAMAQVGQNLTESLMLASAGQQGGLPMDLAIQQLVNMEKGKFKAQAFTNKFRAAFQKNPLLKNFLMRAEDEINKMEAGSSEKLAVIMDVFQRALPEEQIAKMRGSLAGLMESVRSGLMDPQGGLFGLSRAVAEFDERGNSIGNLMKKNVDTYGNILYKISEDLTTETGEPMMLAGKAVKKGAELTAKQLEELGLEFDKTTGIVRNAGKDVGKFSTSTTYLFEQLREIGANYGAVLTQVVGLLPSIFDPFAKMTKALVPLRDDSIEFFRVFSSVNESINAQADYMKKTGDTAMKGVATNLRKQVMARGALFTFADFLSGTGAMGAEEAQKIKDQLVGEGSRTKEAVDGFDETAAALFKQMFSRLLNSDLTKRIAEVFGTLFGGIIRTTFDIINGLMTGFVEEGPMKKVMDGFIAGFNEQFKDMGGFSGFMQKVNDLLAKIISEIGKFVMTTVIPFLIKSLIQFIIGGFKAGPIGALMSGALLVGLVKGVIGMTTAAYNAAISLKAAAASAKQFALGFGKPTFGPQQTAAGTKGMMLGSSIKSAIASVQEFFFGPIKDIKGKGALDSARSAMKTYKGSGGIMGKLGAGIQNFKVGAGIKQMLGAGLKSGLKMGAVGGILKAGLGLLEGKSPLDAISEGLASAGGSAIGAAIGTVIFPGVGTAIGALIGGIIADNQGVINFVKGALMGLGEVFTAVSDAIGPVFSSIGEIFTGLIGIFTSFGLSAEGANEGMSGLQLGINTIRFALLPLVGLINGLAVVFAGLEGGIAMLDYAIGKVTWNQERQNKALERAAAAQEKVEAAATRQQNYNENLFAPVVTSPPGATPTPIPGATTPTIASPQFPTAAVTKPVPAFPTEAITKPIADLKAPIDATTTAVKETQVPVTEAKTAMEALKTELPPAIDTSVKTGVEPVAAKIDTMNSTVSTAASQVVSALSVGQKVEVYAQTPLPVRMEGIAGLLAAAGGGKTKGAGYKGWFPMYKGNVYSAAGGMNLGSAIATEMRNKPAGSDLVIANSAETIIPPGMGVGSPRSTNATIQIGDINVMVSGADNPKEIANQVAEEILDAIQRSSYDELFTN